MIHKDPAKNAKDGIKVSDKEIVIQIGSSRLVIKRKVSK